MVTVATKLDVPIKLTFQAADRRSILGLGDIVINDVTLFRPPSTKLRVTCDRAIH